MVQQRRRTNFKTTFGLGVATAMVATAGLTLAVVATAAISARAETADSLSTTSVDTRETAAGDLVADAVRAAAGAEIALVPAGAFHSGASVMLPAGADQALRLVERPDDGIVVLSLTGAKVRAALERAALAAPQPSAGFLQISGLRTTVDTGRKAGQRLTAINVGDAALDPAKTYTVAMTRSLADGQHGYFLIWDQVKPRDTGKTIETALRDLATARGGSFTSTTDGRITLRP